MQSRAYFMDFAIINITFWLSSGRSTALLMISFAIAALFAEPFCFVNVIPSFHLLCK
jgi:hypothetical protein